MNDAAAAESEERAAGDPPSDSLVDLRRGLAAQPTIQHDAGPHILTLESRHGLFSARSIDQGTALLLRELEPAPSQRRVLDFGCGYGAIGLTLAARWPEAEVVLVDSDLRAVEATRANIAANRLTNATVALSPGLRDIDGDPYDLIVANLPAQAGNDALDEILLEAHDYLADGGTLAVVIVNGIRRYIQRRLQLIFGPSPSTRRTRASATPCSKLARQAKGVRRERRR